MSPIPFRSGVYIVPTSRRYIERTVWLVAGDCPADRHFGRPGPTPGNLSVASHRDRRIFTWPITEISGPFHGRLRLGARD